MEEDHIMWSFFFLLSYVELWYDYTRGEIMRRWNIVCVIAILIGLLYPMTNHVQAEEAAGYVYESLDVAVRVNEQREYHVVETMRINFEEERHGIIRNIPKISSVERAEVEDIQVSGMPFEVDDRNDEARIKIGDPNVSVTGIHEVILSYTLTHHEDYDHSADYVYLNVLGTDYDTEIKQFHATITLFDGEQLEDFKVTSGDEGSRGNALVKGNLDGNVLELTNKQVIKPFQGVSVQMRFPQGYFSAAPEYEYAYVINENTIHVEVDEQQDFHVVQTITYTSDSNHQTIMLPLISASWNDGDYEVLNIKAPEESRHHVYDTDISILAQQGQHSVTLSYDVHPYHMFDESVMFTLTNPEEDTKIEQLTLDIKAPVSNTIEVLLGRTGDDVLTDRYTLTQDEDTIHFVTKDSLEPAERLEVTIPISSNDFHRAMGNSIWLAGLVAVGVLFIILCLRFGLFHHRKLVIPVNFEAPKGMNSAEAGYIIDLDVSSVDITSLIFYWADLGYLRIHNIKNDYSFEKLKDLDVSHPVYEHELFHAMFSYGTKGIVHKSDLKGCFYLDVKEAKKAITKKYTGANSLTSAFGKLLRNVCKLISVIPFIFYIMTTNYAMYHSTMRAGTWLMIFAIFCFTFYSSFHQKGVNASIIAWMKRGMSMILLYIIFVMTNTEISLPTIVITACMILSITCSNGIEKDSRLREQLLIPLLGLKEFIELVEKDRLELLIEEDPQYYYHILPFAQVLHVSKIWTNKFKDITIEVPHWYVGDTNINDFDRNMRYLMFDMNATVTPPKSSASHHSSSFSDHDSSGSNGFSSGGSVGGGSGGGGSRSW